MSSSSKGTMHRLKKWFFEKPTGDFWMWAFIYSIIFRWVAPTVIWLYTFFMLGLVIPESNITPTMEKVTTNLAERFMTLAETMFEIGQGIGTNYPILGKVLFFVFANLVWVIWVGTIFAGLHLIRYFIAWVITISQIKRTKRKIRTRRKSK